MATRTALHDKLVVSNKAALRTKYGAAGLKQLNAALSALIAADKKRGLKTRVVYLDDARSMKAIGAPVVTAAGSPRQNKSAIDGLYAKLAPDYLVLLGAPDVIPHQDVANPVYKPGDDDDQWVFSDVPYACNAGYSRDAAKFVGPTRVVTRLPDLTGATDVSFLLSLLTTATGYTRRPHTDYASGFGLTAKVWKGSTSLSLFKLFGRGAALNSSPTAGPVFSLAQLAPLAHFINCHGMPSDPTFYGQTGERYPEALTSKAVNRRIKPGTLAAVECCYGGELYDSFALGLDLPICQNYLGQGAYAAMGSTTVAYGPATGNGVADLICQYFLLAMFEGASVGRAGLEARQRFVQQAAQMDPVDLKTLMQFCVYGDASLHPVSMPATTEVPKSLEALAGLAGNSSERYLRSERRAGLESAGRFLSRYKPTASQKSAQQAGAQVSAQLAAILKATGLSTTHSGFVAFAVKAKSPAAGPATASRGLAAMSVQSADVSLRYHVNICAASGQPEGHQRAGVAVVAKQIGNRIVDYRLYERHG